MKILGYALLAVAAYGVYFAHVNKPDIGSFYLGESVSVTSGFYAGCEGVLLGYNYADEVYQGMFFCDIGGTVDQGALEVRGSDIAS